MVMNNRKKLPFLFLSALLPFFFSCSLRTLAVDSLADMLAGSGGTVFTGDEDPELVGEALPFALKLYESLLSASPENSELLLTAGTGFISYANVYVHTPADMLPREEYRKQREMRNRAKALYLRGRDYVLRGLEVRHPGFLEALGRKDFEKAFLKFSEEDVPYLYWAAAGWLSAVGFDVLDTELMITVPSAFSLAVEALSLDESWGQGSIHELFISVYGSVPEYLLFRPEVPEGGDTLADYLKGYYGLNLGSGELSVEEKGRFHFERALDLAQGEKSSPYLSYALAFARKRVDPETLLGLPEEYISLLEQALEVDPKASEANVLVNTVNQRKARWLLENLDIYFILEADDEW
ncbi:MAG: TRAP transporter TatT component family protein [Spirochaetales bacterium]|nr:TRAP transporter TatT component family protein [Spirochaetales bacterium]